MGIEASRSASAPFAFGAEYVRAHFADDIPLGIQQVTHNRYRTNPEPIIDHILRCLSLDGREGILDLGCGNGFLLRDIATRMREGGRIVALDISAPMLERARRNIGTPWVPVEWVHGRAEDLSAFENGQFDRVMANFLFHYIEDPDLVCSGMARVLDPRGLALVTVEARGSMPEMYELHFEGMRAAGFPADFIARLPRGRRGKLTLETASPILQRHFASVEERPYVDSLRFHDPRPFMDFYVVGHRFCGAQAVADGAFPQSLFQDLYAWIEEVVRRRIADQGYFEVRKFNSCFVCRAG